MVDISNINLDEFYSKFRTTIRVRDILDDDFINYKKPSMLIVMPYCTFKCDIDGKKICHNHDLINSPIVEINHNRLIRRYLDNHDSNAIIFAGLDPMLYEPYYKDKEVKPIFTMSLYSTYGLHLHGSSFTDMLDVINLLRTGYQCTDDIVIYTGYTKEELMTTTEEHGSILPILDINKHTKGDIIIKYGRYIENDTPHIDPILGIPLASSNQYAELYRNGEKIDIEN